MYKIKIYIDLISIILCLITIIFFMLIINKILSFEDYKEEKSFSFLIIASIFLILIELFIETNLLKFFILFEFTLILIFFVINSWGVKKERIEAGLFIIFYTIIFSVPRIISIIYWINKLNRIQILNNNIRFLNFKFSFIFKIVIIIIFVKLPIYLLHVWLPKAHVEAPLMGSIILAGIMLKLGGYGLYRFIIFLLKFKSKNYNLIFNWGLWTFIIISFYCFMQSNIKVIIAFSSIVHIRIIIVGYSSKFLMSLLPIIILIFSHGFISSLMFYSFELTYISLLTRRILIIRGLFNINKKFVYLVFLLIVINISTPPFLSFFSELLLFKIFYIKFNLTLIIFLIGFFIRGIYNIYIYAFLNISNKQTTNFITLNKNEILIYYIHLKIFLIISFLIRPLSI